MTIDQARRQAADTNAAIANGESINEKKRSVRDEMTMGDLFDLYLERHAKVHKKSWKADIAQYDNHVNPWAGETKLSRIKKQDVQKLHVAIGKNSGIYAANRILALVHAMFARASDWGWSGTNPATGIRKFKEQARSRFLESDELPRFFKSLAEETNITLRDYFLLSILTGVRRSNLLEMRWDETNLDRAVWVIPHEKAKTKENYHIPLVPEAVAILNQRNTARSSGWVFPSTGKTGHLVEPKNAWKRILDRAGLTDLRIHDLRRSLGSWQAATGANLSVIGKTLGHKNVSTTAIYARLNLDPVRESMETATTAMMVAGGLVVPADVVNINSTKK